jgi:hypothetical protein
MPQAGISDTRCMLEQIWTYRRHWHTGAHSLGLGFEVPHAEDMNREQCRRDQSRTSRAARWQVKTRVTVMYYVCKRTRCSDYATGWMSANECKKCFSSPERPYWLQGPPSLLVKEHQVPFPRGYSGRCLKLTTHLHLRLKIRISAGIPVLPLYAYMVCTEKI